MKHARLAVLIGAAGAVLVLIVSLVLGLERGGDAAAINNGEDGLPERGLLRVEVLNASNIPGLARRGTEHLRESGFDVVFYGNASGFSPDTSLVLDRLGNLQAAQQVADALGVQQVRAVPDTTLYLDVTVVLGSDWAGVPDL